MSPRPACPAIRDVLNRVGDKWSVQIVAMLGEGTARFTELRTGIEGISQRMLTLTLRGLERDGLIARKVFAEVPPRVEYTLTELGRTLLVPIRGLAEWADEHRTSIQDARARYELRQAQGKQLRGKQRETVQSRGKRGRSGSR
jgi:DNA-binding HxlR family transcriptional regulator